MKKLLILLAVGAIAVPVVVFSGSPVKYDIPHQINYQGMLTDNDGNPLTGNFDILFKIYNHPWSGTRQWEETQTGVWVNEGLFNVILGSVTPIDLNFYKRDQYWLDITVGGVGGEHMPQRLKFTSVAFAYRAQKADTAVYAIQVESYPHDHDADYVNVNGPDSVTGSSSGSMLRVKNYGSGDGIYIYAPASGAGDGIYIDSAGDRGIEIRHTGDDGILIHNSHQDGIYIINTGYDGIRIINSADDGISMDNIGDDGIYMDDIAGDGIYMHDVEDHGIYINDAADYGLYVKKADYGIYIDSTRGGYDGIYIKYAEDDGITVSHADDDGIYVVDADDDGVYVSNAGGNGVVVWNAGGDGIYVNHADRYGLRIYSDNDGIFVSSANGDGITAFGATGGGEIISQSADYYGLEVRSKMGYPSNKGLKVYGYAIATGGWGKSVPGSSGDVPAFSVCSPDVELIVSGTGVLVNGQAQINFEQEFQEAISTEVPIRVVVTAQDAPSALLYVTNKSTQGFTVKPLEIPELSLKTDNVSFDWIAIARQKGYEQRPEVLIEEEESSADLVNREEEMRAEELRHQEELEREARYRQQMLEKQARKEAERLEREKEREEESTD